MTTGYIWRGTGVEGSMGIGVVVSSVNWQTFTY